MESNDLSLEQVVTGSDVSRDLDVHAATAGVQILGSPVVVRAGGAGGGPCVLEDLEPAGAAISRGGIGDLGHVGLDGTVMVTSDGLIGAAAVAGLLVHLNGDGLAGDYATLVFDTNCTADVAANVGAGNGGDGRVGRRRADTVALVHGLSAFGSRFRGIR